jgi:hypothetical protein
MGFFDIPPGKEKDPNAWITLGKSFENFGRKEEALTAYDHAIELDKSSFEAIELRDKIISAFNEKKIADNEVSDDISQHTSRSSNNTLDGLMDFIIAGIVGVACGYVMSIWGFLPGLVVLGATWSIILGQPSYYILGIMGFFALISMKAFGG